MDENGLIGASRDGDARAFNQLVADYQGQVYNLAYRILSEPESAADATQDAFLSAYRNIRQFRGGSFRAWLMRIATNACYDELRRRKRSPQAASLDQALDEDTAPEPPDREPTPEERIIRRDMQQHLQRGLATLPYDQRVVVVLSDVQGLSYEEIAEVTNASLGTVKSRLSRGRAHMRDFLVRSGELSPARFRHD